MATFQYNYLSKQAAGRNWPIGHSLQPLSQLIPDAQQLMVAEGRAVWPEPTMDSAGRVQKLSADPTSINREIITFRLQAFAGTISHSTWKSSSLPLPEGKKLWPQKWWLPHVLQGSETSPETELISWPCPGMWQGFSQLSSCCPPP